MAESDQAYAKMIEINSRVEHEDYGPGVYVNEPEIIRGRERMLRKRKKEKYELQYEDEVRKFRED